MKLIESSAELLTQGQGLLGIYKMIELAGRTCYKSEANITADSAAEFVGRMVKSGHTAMLEHGTVYLLIPYWNSYEDTELTSFFRHNPYSKTWGPMEDSVNWHITTNYRVLVENNLVEKCKPFLCTPTKYHSLRISMRFITSIGISRELTRHRVFSFANESTRYCNYGSDRFNNEITFIIPSWFNEEQHRADRYKMLIVMDALKQAEGYYMDLIKGKTFITKILSGHVTAPDEITEKVESVREVDMVPMTPQQAREFLPLCTKSEIVMTGFVSDWKHFFDLRYFGTTGKPHPDMLELSTKAKEVLEKAGLWRLIESEMKNQHEN